MNKIGKNNLRQGYWEIKNTLNQTTFIEEGYYIDGEREGEWKYYEVKNKKVLISIVNYKFGLEHGTTIVFLKEDVLNCVSEWEDGHAHGLFINYHDDGINKSSIKIFDKDILIGLEQFFHKDGSIDSSNFYI